MFSCKISMYRYDPFRILQTTQPSHSNRKYIGLFFNGILYDTHLYNAFDCLPKSWFTNYEPL